jgi:hypothetical protein
MSDFCYLKLSIANFQVQFDFAAYLKITLKLPRVLNAYFV